MADLRNLAALEIYWQRPVQLGLLSGRAPNGILFFRTPTYIFFTNKSVVVGVGIKLMYSRSFIGELVKSLCDLGAKLPTLSSPFYKPVHLSHANDIEGLFVGEGS